MEVGMNFRSITHMAVAGLILTGALVAGSPKPEDDYHFDRDRMVKRQVAARGIKDKAVLQSMRTVPRHELVPTNLIPHAYEDRPLPIGHGQTISQPYIVGLMTELLDLEPDDKVLEIGTGSGYQAAILGQIVKQVISLEIVGPLATRARAKLQQLEYSNIKVVHADGYYGYEDEAPFDAIIVTAAAEHIPPPLLKQLKPGGKMVIPVGRSGWTQNLLLVEKNDAGQTKTRNMLPVRFVPFTRTKR
jgi:protein-L-isoaspartate(D-aspartate) O-methyltransferase